MADRGTLIITPKTKVGELLDQYPVLEPVLLDLAPAFKKLKNPVLRKTIGRVATLQQAASIGGISVAGLVNALRAEVGQEIYHQTGEAAGINFTKPAWFDEAKVKARFDAGPLINSGNNPMQEVFSRLESTGENEIFLLLTPFVPAPIIDLIARKGYSHYCEKKMENEFHTFFSRL